MFIRMLSHAIKVKENLHSKNAFSWRYTLFLLIIIRFKTSMRNISSLSTKSKSGIAAIVERQSVLQNGIQSGPLVKVAWTKEY